MPEALKDPWHTDTADPARVFRQMFALPPWTDWRLSCHPDDFRKRWGVRR